MTTATSEVVTVDGEEFYQWKFVARVPKNWTPESGVLILCAPPGGIANIPAVVEGAPGLPPVIRNSSVVPLAYDDPSPDTFTWTLITPGSATVQPVYDVVLSIHTGEPGAAGTMELLTAGDLDAGDIAAPTAGYIFAVKSLGGSPETFGVELVAQKVGNTYWPASLNVLSNATGQNALCPVVIPAAPFARRLRVNGQQHIHPDGADVQVDLVARLGGTGTGDGSLDGLVIARGLGLANGADQILAFTAAPPVGSTAGFGQLAAGSGATVYINAEVIAGTSTFDTISGRGLFSVDAEPVG